MRLFFACLTSLLFVSLASCDRFPNYQNEVYGFLYETNASICQQIRWDKLTTVVLVGLESINPFVINYAHNQQVRVQLQSVARTNLLLNETAQRNWIKRRVDIVQENDLQGINLHFTDMITKGSPLVNKLTELVKALADELHSRIPGSKLSFNAPWASRNAIGTAVDERNYNYLAIYNIVNHFVVYSFHVYSQQFIGNEYQDEECYAHATSGLYTSAGGLLSWISYVQNTGSSGHSYDVLSSNYKESLKINPEALDISKIIYVQPWFAIDYTCLRFTQYTRCILPSIWYRGVDCTDRAGSLVTASQANEIFNRNGSTWEYDPHSGTGYIQYTDNDNNLHQVWLDNPQTLALKYTFVKEFAVGGTGVYALNFLNYTDTDSVNTMFNPLPDYKSQALNKQ